MHFLYLKNGKETEIFWETFSTGLMIFQSIKYREPNQNDEKTNEISFRF